MLDALLQEGGLEEVGGQQDKEVEVHVLHVVLQADVVGARFELEGQRTQLVDRDRLELGLLCRLQILLERHTKMSFIVG